MIENTLFFPSSETILEINVYMYIQHLKLQRKYGLTSDAINWNSHLHLLMIFFFLKVEVTCFYFARLNEELLTSENNQLLSERESRLLQYKKVNVADRKYRI